MSAVSFLVFLFCIERSVGADCNETSKQKALYAYFDHEPSLEDAPAFEIESEVTWTNVTSLRTWNKNGIYDAFMVYLAASPGKEAMSGYFGVQAKTGNASRDMLLFSLWDKNPGEGEEWQAAIPMSSEAVVNVNVVDTKPSIPDPEGHLIRIYVGEKNPDTDW